MPLAAAPRPIVPLWAAVLTSVASGVLLTTAFPALSWWPMAFPAVVLALIGLVGRTVWSSLLVGFAFGAAFFFVNLIFTARYLGPVPWIALSMLEALLTAAGAVPITLAYRWLPRVLPGLAARLVLLPLLVAGLWTLREQVVGSWPYGGFPWGRIGITQANSPLADLASWVGVSGLTFLVVLLCAAAIEYVRAARFRRVVTALPTVIVALLLAARSSVPDDGCRHTARRRGAGQRPGRLLRRAHRERRAAAPSWRRLLRCSARTWTCCSGPRAEWTPTPRRTTPPPRSSTISRRAIDAPLIVSRRDPARR